ncbi:MAG: hypothetical protein WBO36_12150, partial [Saprospiraceae bacterium]
GNHLFRSNNEGRSWHIISPDLTTNDPMKTKKGQSGGITPDNTGAETHCTIHSTSVSSIHEAVIWVGTDDGLVQVTNDGGKVWTNVRPNIPEVPSGIWVSRVEASHFHPGRAYVTFDGHRSDEFDTWVFVTDDFGKSWRKITAGISSGETVRVIREDLTNENLLFIGTETGVWYSLDRGLSWEKLQGLPTVSVYDLKIHPRENDLIIGTHGRGIWIMDDISPMQQLSTDIQNKKMHLFDQKSTVLWENTSRGGQRGHFWWAGDNPKNVSNTSSKARAGFKITVPVTFYINHPSIDSATITITDPIENYSFIKIVKVHQGVNIYYWDRELDAKSYTESERKFIINTFKELIAADGSENMKFAYQRFLRAGTPSSQRKAASILTTDQMSHPLPDRYGVLTAGAGIYEVRLKAKTQTEVQSFEILNDPMSR